MNDEFAEYISQLKKQILATDTNLQISEKTLQYGLQLTVTDDKSKVVLSVYNGKKGRKLVWGGSESELKERLQQAMNAKDGASFLAKSTNNLVGNDYTLLRNCADFKGIWVGSDESGKGDFFGPLVVAAALVDSSFTAEKLVASGVKDCKLVNDKEVLRLAEAIKEIVPVYNVLALKPEMYNYRYQQLRAEGKNLNHLLSNGHIAVLSNVLRVAKDCNYALVDQFTNSNNIALKVQEEFPDVNVVQQHRAEADIAVAAASILARAKFLETMLELAKDFNLDALPKGGSELATAKAREIARSYGRSTLEKLVKVHFANYKKI